MWQRELDIIIVHLFSEWSPGISRFDALDLHDLDAVSSSTMSGSHVTVTLSDSPGPADVSVFTVHVVGP